MVRLQAGQFGSNDPARDAATGTPLDIESTRRAG
jgi:hypothetical protein